MCHCRCQCQACKHSILGGPLRSSPSISVRQLDVVARGPWLAQDADVKASPVGTWAREATCVPGRQARFEHHRPPKIARRSSGVGRQCRTMLLFPVYCGASLEIQVGSSDGQSFDMRRKCQVNPSRQAAVSRSGRVQLVFNFNGTGCRRGEPEGHACWAELQQGP